ncbi:6-hydroxymethylpterin diphosphokinase MptE-like protein [Lacunisphaera limnophila]|nr:6-hydroxymethylpterin diphosphokinase MptE-like protein [Lacunisphaera limnophila]
MSSNHNPDHTLQGVRAQRPTINPYRYALRQVIDRMIWDLGTESFRSRKKLHNWKDRFPGKGAVIACNGPSLLRTDLSLLDGVFTFGLNKINLLFEKNKFRPSCIVAVNPLVIEQNADFYNETELPLFIDGVGRTHIRSRSNVAFLHSSSQPKLARDCTISINQGYTVTTVALQLAFHMGFRKVALVGCDHNFATKGPANKVVVSGSEDASHFDPRYFSGGQKWQLPDLAGSEFFYSMAQDMFCAHGGSITNCTDGGKLEIFPRENLTSWLAR